MNIKPIVLSQKQIASPRYALSLRCPTCNRKVFAGQPLILLEFGSEVSYKNRVTLLHDDCLRMLIGPRPHQASSINDAAMDIAKLL